MKKKVESFDEVIININYSQKDYLHGNVLTFCERN